VILIVDDEESVRSFVRHLAQSAGYEVMEAAGGEEALAILHQFAPGPELLLTDIVMPGMSGLELAAQAHHLRPSMPVIFMSGFASQYEEELSGSVCLRKPFRPSELLTAIQDVIGPAHPVRNLTDQA
jgi:two-component system cell cycle sensor histidine kinase/response regulator CckA